MQLSSLPGNVFIGCFHRVFPGRLQNKDTLSSSILSRLASTPTLSSPTPGLPATQIPELILLSAFLQAQN